MNDAKIVSALLASCQKANQEYGETPHITVPDGFTIESIENLMPHPSRIRGFFVTKSLPSLIAYTKRFYDAERTASFADIELKTLVVIFDYHSKMQPSWLDHIAIFSGQVEQAEAELTDKFPSLPIFYGRYMPATDRTDIYDYQNDEIQH